MFPFWFVVVKLINFLDIFYSSHMLPITAEENSKAKYTQKSTGTVNADIHEAAAPPVHKKLVYLVGCCVGSSNKPCQKQTQPQILRSKGIAAKMKRKKHSQNGILRHVSQLTDWKLHALYLDIPFLVRIGFPGKLLFDTDCLLRHISAQAAGLRTGLRREGTNDKHPAKDKETGDKSAYPDGTPVCSLIFMFHSIYIHIRLTAPKAGPEVPDSQKYA